MTRFKNDTSGSYVTVKKLKVFIYIVAVSHYYANQIEKVDDGMIETS